MTLPLAIDTTTWFHQQDIAILLPFFADEHWQFTRYWLGRKSTPSERTWAYNGLLALLDETDFFNHYFQFWQAAFVAYSERQPSPIYWLTNGCGQPIPRPTDWPNRGSGSGYETVSDSKTSVGLDRTDDIKKAVYQVLKLGVMCKPCHTYQVKVGILSNIHAARHYDEYVAPLSDMVWATTRQIDLQQASDLDPMTPIFRVLDGLIALTKTSTHDKWIRDHFRFLLEED